MVTLFFSASLVLTTGPFPSTCCGRGLWVVVGFNTPGYDNAGAPDPGLVKDLLRYSLITSPKSLPSTPDSKVMNYHSLDTYMEVQ